jgi:hypothetical protein
MDSCIEAPGLKIERADVGADVEHHLGYARAVDEAKFGVPDLSSSSHRE